MARPEHISVALARGLAKVRRRRLAPLNPDAFLAWAWSVGPRDKGTHPLTVDDVWFELVRLQPAVTVGEVWREYVRIAARVRRNQRMGLEPFEGIC